MWRNKALCLLLTLCLLTGCAAASGETAVGEAILPGAEEDAAGEQALREALRLTDAADVLDGYDFAQTWAGSQLSYNQLSGWGSEHRYQIVWVVSQNGMQMAGAGAALLEDEGYAQALLRGILALLFQSENACGPYNASGGQERILQALNCLEAVQVSGLEPEAFLHSLADQTGDAEQVRSLASDFGEKQELLLALKGLSGSESWQAAADEVIQRYDQAVSRCLTELLNGGTAAEPAELWEEGGLLPAAADTSSEPCVGVDTLMGVCCLEEAASAQLRSAQEAFLAEEAPHADYSCAFSLYRALKLAEYRILQSLCGAESVYSDFLLEELDKLAALSECASKQAGVYEPPGNDSEGQDLPFTIQKR